MRIIVPIDVVTSNVGNFHALEISKNAEIETGAIAAILECTDTKVMSRNARRGTVENPYKILISLNSGLELLVPMSKKEFEEYHESEYEKMVEKMTAATVKAKDVGVKAVTQKRVGEKS